MRNKLIVIAILCITLSGCASLVAKAPKVILLPEERIFTIPGGQEVKVWLDQKEMTMVFPEDMKLVSPTVLVRQEEKLNNALLGKIQANAKNKATWGIVGSILAILAGVLGLFRKKIWPSISAKVDVK